MNDDERRVEIPHHVFLSHNWGDDEEGRYTCKSKNIYLLIIYAEIIMIVLSEFI